MDIFVTQKENLENDYSRKAITCGYSEDKMPRGYIDRKTEEKKVIILHGEYTSGGVALTRYRLLVISG